MGEWRVTGACFSYQRPLSGVSLARSKVRVETRAPATLSLVAHEPASFADCEIRFVQGRVADVAGDTLMLQPLFAKAAARGHQACAKLWSLRSVQVVPRTTDQLLVRRYNRTRSVVLGATVLTITVMAMRKTHTGHSGSFRRGFLEPRPGESLVRNVSATSSRRARRSLRPRALQASPSRTPSRRCHQDR